MIYWAGDMSAKACDLSGNCGACRRKVRQGVFCDSCGMWFHYGCSNTTSDKVSLCDNWSCELCHYKTLVVKQEETIANLRYELELFKIQLGSRNVTSTINSDLPDFKVVPRRNRRRRRFSAEDVSEIKLTNRFNVLETMEVDQPSLNPPQQASAEVDDRKSKVLLLGSSHGRGIANLLKEELGTDYEICSIVKPSAGLTHVTEDLVKLSSGFTKRDHIVIVGGPGNSLDRDASYSVEKDLENISKDSRHTNVEVVELFDRHDKPWLHSRVRSMNARLGRALIRPDASHIGVIEVGNIKRDDYTYHGLHLNSRGKKKLSHLIANRIKGRIPVITNIIPAVHHRASPFLG